MDDFNYNLIDKAYNVIKEHVIKTPLVTNDNINKLLGSKVFFKLENLQKTGSFKFRGATYKLSTLSDSQKNNGVVAYSSGNHAQAVAYSSLSRNINAKIIMPSNAPKIKIENTKNYKANVVLYNPVKEVREEIGDKIAKDENRTIIPPYDDYNIIAGQGTLGKEISDQLESMQIIPDLYLCCCGGGGLIAGTSTYLKYKFPKIKSYSVEPKDFEDTKFSLERGFINKNKDNNFSICDALLAPQPGRLTFPINIKNLSGGFVVTDEEVKNTITFLAEHLKIISEPGGAVAAAAILHNKIDIKNKNVVVMISGGNIDIDMFLNL